MLNKKSYISDNKMDIYIDDSNMFPYNYSGSESSLGTPKNPYFYTLVTFQEYLYQQHFYKSFLGNQCFLIQQIEER